MNNILKILSVFFIVLIIFSSCISQNSQNFDQIKAAKTRVSLGLAYLQNGNFSQAKFNLDKALEFAPRLADANYAMAYYYQSVGELKQAENFYQFAMDLEPKNANIANSYGAFLCQNGDYEKAKKYFLQAVNTSKYISSAETYENLALCSRSQGRYEDVIQYLRNAVNHQPRRANSLFLLARSLVETHQWQEARDILRRYEKTSQISPQSLFMAMKIESATGNDNAANGYSDMLLNIFPNDPITKSLLIDQLSLLEVDHKADKTTGLKSEQNIPIIYGKDTDIEADEMVHLVVPVTEQLTEQIKQVEPEILKTPEFHIVAKGENLYRISLLYNIRMQRLIDWNGLADASAIFDGKNLSLVAPSVVE
jgi:type IV pilus assembly protein PilF